MRFRFNLGNNTQSKQMGPWSGIFMGLIFLVIGICLLLFSFSSIKSHNEKSKSYVEIDSIVVDYKINSDGLQAIIVEYVVDGQTFTKESNSYSNMPKDIGTEVAVKYNPNNPGDAIWVHDSTNIILPVIGGLFSVFGLIFVVSMSVSLVKGNKSVQNEEQLVMQPNGLYSVVDSQDNQNNQNYM